MLQLPPETESRIRAKAARAGQDAEELLRRIVEKELSVDESDPAYLLTLPLAERRRIMAAQFAEAAPLYAADLARPIEERELTAFTALDGEPFIEDADAH